MKPIALNDFLQFKSPSSVTLSPSGNAVAYVLTSIKEDKYSKELHLWKDNKDLLLLQDDKLSYFEFADNNKINFISIRGEKDKTRSEKGEIFTSLYQIKIDGGEAYKLYELPLAVEKIKRIDERRLLLKASINRKYPDLYKASKKEKDRILKEIEDNKDYEELTESPFWANGGSFTQDFRSNLFLFDEKSKKLERLLEPSFNVSSFLIRDHTIYLSGGAFDTVRKAHEGIYSYDLDSKELKEVVANEYSIFFMELLRDQIIVFASRNERYGFSENPFIYRLDEDGLTLINEADESLGHGILNDVEYGSKRHAKADGDYLYFSANDGYNTNLKRVDIQGNIEPVINVNGAITDFDVIDGNIYYLGLLGTELEDLYSFQNGKSKKLLSFNAPYFKNRYVAKPQYLKTVYQGEEIDGWVLYPYEFDKSQQYPAILDIHGGPKCAYGEVYFHEMQVWASKGYFVMYCNPHGSDGKGNAFADLRVKMGTIDYENIMAFVDNVLSHYPNIDKDKLGCTGGSYGGFMSNWILGHTDRFKAIATQRSISNWVTEYGVSDIPPQFDDWTNDVHPYSEEGFANQWRQSPLKYIINAKTPTLIVHSDQDYRCPISDGYQLYTALVFLGIPTKMVVFHGENHELSRAGKPPHRIKRLSEITGWFDKYLK